MSGRDPSSKYYINHHIKKTHLFLHLYIVKSLRNILHSSVNHLKLHYLKNRLILVLIIPSIFICGIKH